MAWDWTASGLGSSVKMSFSRCSILNSFSSFYLRDRGMSAVAEYTALTVRPLLSFSGVSLASSRALAMQFLSYRWLSAILQYLQCVINGVTAVVCLAIDIQYIPWNMRSVMLSFVLLWFCYNYTLRFNEVEKGVYWFHLVCPSVCPSVYTIVSALYLQQYLSDPFHICTSYQAEGVSHVMFV